MALGAAMAFMGANAMANNLILNLSGTAEVQGTNGADKGTIKTLSLNEKSIYAIISSAVTNAASYSTNLASLSSTTLPSDGYIVFNPEASDTTVTGVFYVTNKTGFYFPLSGLTTNAFSTNYYSFIELDTTLIRGGTNGIETNNWGFSTYYYGGTLGAIHATNETINFETISSYSLGKTTGTGSDKSLSKALLYIHDNPLAYGDPPNDLSTSYDPEQYPFNPFFLNSYSALEIGGILTANLGIKTNSVVSGTLTLPGTGNFYYAGTYHGVTTGAKATLTVVK